MNRIDETMLPIECPGEASVCTPEPSLIGRLLGRRARAKTNAQEPSVLGRLGTCVIKGIGTTASKVYEAVGPKAKAAWPFIRKMGIYFCAFSVIGHLVEWPYCWAGMKFFGTVDPAAEVLTNPFKPFFVYGVGIVLCSVALNPVRDFLKEKCPSKFHAIASFYAGAVFLGMAFELAQGFTQNRPVDGVYPLWDVSDYPGNILGQAWIVNDLLIGALITFIVWAVLPPLDRAMDRLSERTANRLFEAVVAGTALLTLATYI